MSVSSVEIKIFGCNDNGHIYAESEIIGDGASDKDIAMIFAASVVSYLNENKGMAATFHKVLDDCGVGKSCEPVKHCKSCNLLREVAMMDGSRISVCDGGNDEMEQVDPNDEACDKYEELLPEE